MNRSCGGRHGGPLAVALGLSLGLLSSCGGQSAPSDAQVVAASLVRLPDLPRGQEWKDTGRQNNGNKGLNAGIDACEHRYDPTATSMVDQQTAHNFEGSGADTISSTGGIVRDEAKRNAFFTSLDRQFTCFGHVLAKSLDSGSQPRSVKVAPPYGLDVRTAADRTAGRSLQLEVTVPGTEHQRLTFFLDVVAVEKGDLLAGYLFFHKGDITLADETDVVDRALARVEAQQNG